MNKKRSIFTFALHLLAWVLLTACSQKSGSKEIVIPEIARMEQFTTSKAYPSKFEDESLEAWQKQIPEIKDVRIKSSADGKKEPALFFDSGSKRKKPLLVVLHSWSSRYLQQVSIPYGLWAKKYDWVFMHPNYRGEMNNPEATASELAIQDIVDAVDYAMKHANVDSSRVYLVGSSGGAMSALVAASKHPEIWAGVVAWVPIFDLVDWYDFTLYYPERKYLKEVIASCGGEPIPGTEAAEECKRRSPSSYISNMEGVPLFLAHGLVDVLVPPDHSIQIFNILADSADRISQEHMEHIVKEKTIPEGLESNTQQSYFGKGDPEVVFVRDSDNVKLVLYNGVHDMAYNPSLLWLSEQQRK